LPFWAKDKRALNINARSETVFEKRTFRDAFRYNRCIIPLNGFYEWEVSTKDKSKLKTLYFVHHKNEAFLAVAGLWSEWFDVELNMNIVMVLLITCDANEKLGEIHHRMPVVLEPKDFKTWLFNNDLSTLNGLMKTYESDKLELYEVTSEVNKVAYNEALAIEKVSMAPKGQLSLF
jgi:putative SOS response-associated peptidase YedK